MKFKFCSDGDCPLWALAALHALGSLPAPLFRTLLHHVVEEQPVSMYLIITKGQGTGIWNPRELVDPPETFIILEGDDGIMEILKDTSLSSRDECARAAAVLRWTLKQAHRCGCSGVQLARDLLVLGVPRAHASALADAAETGREAYEAQIKNTGFMINKLTDVTASSGPEGTVDTVKLTLHSDVVFTGEQKTTELIIDKSQVKILLEELKKAQKKMEEINVE